MTRRTIIGIVFVLAAILRLADMWGVIHLEWEHSWTANFGPILLLYIGIELIIYGFNHNHSQWLQRPIPQSEEGKRICCSASFGADEYVYHGETFHGARLDAFVGGLRLNLSEATITEDEEIDIHTCMGGVEVLVSTEMNVEVKSHNFIGSVNNEAAKCQVDHAPTIHVIASNFLGGVNIRRIVSTNTQQ